MLPLFPVQGGQLMKSREFVELIECGKIRFQAHISFFKKTFRYYLTNNHQWKF